MGLCVGVVLIEETERPCWDAATSLPAGPFVVVGTISTDETLSIETICVSVKWDKRHLTRSCSHLAIVPPSVNSSANKGVISEYLTVFHAQQA